MIQINTCCPCNKICSQSFTHGYTSRSYRFLVEETILPPDKTAKLLPSTKGFSSTSSMRINSCVDCITTTAATAHVNQERVHVQRQKGKRKPSAVDHHVCAITSTTVCKNARICVSTGFLSLFCGGVSSSFEDLKKVFLTTARHKN
jgi:hypothetical protein